MLSQARAFRTIGEKCTSDQIRPSHREREREKENVTRERSIEVAHVKEGGKSEAGKNGARG